MNEGHSKSSPWAIGCCILFLIQSRCCFSVKNDDPIGFRSSFTVTSAVRKNLDRRALRLGYQSKNLAKHNILKVVFDVPYGGALTNSDKETSALRSIMEPVALVAISDIENLQCEISRLRSILDERNISFKRKEYTNDTCDGDQNISNCIRQKLKRVAGGAMVEVDGGKENVEIHSNGGDALIAEASENTCSYVNHILNGRLEEVMNKKRSKTFTKTYKKHLDAIDGEFSIISLHGREQQQQQQNHRNGNIQEDEGQKILKENVATAQQVQLVSNDHYDSYFPPNLMSLDMVFTQQMYDLAMEEIEKKHKSEVTDHHSMYTKEALFIPKLMIRALHLGLNFAPVTLTLGLASFSKDFREKVWFNLVGRCLAKSGPAFIKWGQWASTRPDVFPDTLCQVLSELHADAPAHRWETTQKIVEEALCIPKGTLYEVFEEFDQNPVASGSIAQVHRAVLRRPHNENTKKTANAQTKDKGAKVAVKVRHPNVSRLIDMDFRLMAMVANIADQLPALSWLRIKESVQQFSHTMAAQAHLNVEAHHLEVLNHNFRKWETVGFPQPIFACSSVIIETFERGEVCSNLIDKYDSLALAKSPGKNCFNSGHELMPVPLSKFIVTTGVSVYLKMLLVDNLMHADLHPGNILLDCQIFGEQHGETSPLVSVPVGGAEVGNGKASKRRRKENSIAPRVENGFYGQVTLVDAGMVAQLDDNESANFIGLIAALGEGDGRAAAEAILKFKTEGIGRTLSSVEKEAFITDVVSLFEERCRGYGTNVDFGDVLRGVLGLIKKHQVQLGANYATLVVNALCLDGLAKRVCPTYNVLDASKPLLQAYRALPKHDDMVQKTKLRRSLINVATPFLYMKKHYEDKKFFKKIEERRRDRAMARKRNKIKPLKKAEVFRRGKMSRVFIAGLSGLLFHHSISIFCNQRW